MYTYKQHCRRFVFEGNEILRFCAKYPSLDDNSEISAFYEKLAKECEIFCEKIKFSELCEKFNKEKKVQNTSINQKYTYSFYAQISDISDDVVSILLSIIFYRTKNEPILSFSDKQQWCSITNMIIKKDKN